MTIAVTYCSLYCVLVLLGRIGIFRHFRKIKKRQQQQGNQEIGLGQISVIIPFRNEEKRIEPLITSIQQSLELPVQFIFVDDHSTDKAVQRIQEQLSGYPITVLSAKGEGKKAAIQTGIRHADTSYILTLDADVAFQTDYFTAVKQLPPSDMHILPVQMTAKGWKKLFELDVYMVNSLNLAADGFFRPIAASGANLLFRKSAFEEIGAYGSHAHIPSGDDQFLLSDFNQTNKQVSLHADAALSVQTPVPYSIKELIYQRLRWIRKTPKVKDSLAINIGLIQIVMTCFFVVSSVWSIYQQNFVFLFLVLGTKMKFDQFLVAPYFSRIKKQALLYLIPVYTLLFPFYMLLLAILSVIFTPDWKGRSTTNY